MLQSCTWLIVHIRTRNFETIVTHITACMSLEYYQPHSNTAWTGASRDQQKGLLIGLAAQHGGKVRMCMCFHFGRACTHPGTPSCGTPKELTSHPDVQHIHTAQHACNAHRHIKYTQDTVPHLTRSSGTCSPSVKSPTTATSLQPPSFPSPSPPSSLHSNTTWQSFPPRTKYLPCVICVSCKWYTPSHWSREGEGDTHSLRFFGVVGQSTYSFFFEHAVEEET